jgi:hypothetical protein
MPNKKKEIPFFAISNGELDSKPAVGRTVICPNCLKRHKVEYGNGVKINDLCEEVIVPDTTLTTLAFVRCGKKLFLVGIDGKAI